MNSFPPVEETIKRTRRYWYIDGLTEIGAGIVILLTGALFAAQALVPPQWRNWLLVFGQPAIIILGTLGINKAVEAAKQRITYPRTGYVGYQRKEKSSKKVRHAFIAAALLVGVLAAVLAARGLEQRWIPLLMGAIMAVFMLYISWQVSLPRFSWLSAFIFLSGAAVSWLAPVEPWDMAALFGLLSAGSIVSGLMTLRAYLKGTRSLAKDEGRDG